MELGDTWRSGCRCRGWVKDSLGDRSPPSARGTGPPGAPAPARGRLFGTGTRGGQLSRGTDLVRPGGLRSGGRAVWLLDCWSYGSLWNKANRRLGGAVHGARGGLGGRLGGRRRGAFQSLRQFDQDIVEVLLGRRGGRGSVTGRGSVGEPAGRSSWRHFSSARARDQPGSSRSVRDGGRGQGLLPFGGPDPRGRTDEGSTGMSTHRASELAGLLGGTRSMKVRRKEPERCTLATPVYLTRSLRICAASVPLAVVLVRGICGAARPARGLLSASLAGLTRKLPPHPSGASMPCAPGGSGRSVARRRARAEEGATTWRADVACKENYAACVKKIMPKCRDLPIRGTVDLVLEVPGPSATGLLEPTSRTGHRRTVSDPRILRSSRSGSGQIRNAAPSRNRGAAGERRRAERDSRKSSLY